MNILIILIGLFISFQKYTTMAANKTETQPYKVLRKEKDFEIRFYPAATMATITSSAKSYKELSGAGFRQLAGYIFGGNKASQKIAMTTPVHMDINDSASSMSFVMPAAYNKDNLPVPDDSKVSIKTTNEEYVAAIQFGGYASDKDLKLYAEKLKAALNANAISYYGNFRFLGYNAPYELFGRRNEVIVSVKWDSK
jgi:hypothetical protein